MAFLIPAGLLIIGLLCCIGIAVLVVQARTDERKASAQKALAATQKASARSATPTTTVIPATPVPSVPSTPSTEPVNATENASPSAHLPETVAKQTQASEQEVASQDGSPDSHRTNGHHDQQNGHSEFQSLQLFTEVEQISQLFQDDKLSPEWVREQIQELSVKVQDMHQQSSLIERHIALLSQISLYMNELEQVRHEYKVLREKRGAVLRIPTRLHGESADGDTYIQTDKRPTMRKYTLETM
jgi:CCR4-NOT transcriptional regulation complex NOT5 subunit